MENIENFSHLKEETIEPNSVDFIELPDTQEGRKEILTEMSLPLEGNVHNDCGALSIEMILRTDNNELFENNDLEKIKELTGKEGEEGIMPGDVCRVLDDMGFDTEYYSNIDWKKCTLDPDSYFEYYDERIKNVPSNFFKTEDNKDGMVDLHKLSDSAKWLSAHESKINRKEITFDEIADLLSEGKRIIALMHASHYVVITGVDSDYVYINNPRDIPTKEKISKSDFERSWLQVLNSKELIVASQKHKN